MSIVQRTVMVSMFFVNITLLATTIVVGVISWYSSKKYYDHIRELEMELESYRTSTLTKGILIATIVVLIVESSRRIAGFSNIRLRTRGVAWVGNPGERISGMEQRAQDAGYGN